MATISNLSNFPQFPQCQVLKAARKAGKENAGEPCSYGSIQSAGLNHFGRELEPAGWEALVLQFASLCDPLE